MHHKNRNALIGGAFLLLILVLAGPASAHHSVQAQFDIHKTFHGLRNGCQGGVD